MRGSLHLFAATLAVLLGGPIRASAGEDCSGCSLLGSLSVRLTSVAPSAPMVGDVVTFSFIVEYALPGGFDCGLNGRCVFVGGEPFLEGEAPPMFEEGALVVRRRAVQAGLATVQLDLTGETEEACRFEDESGCVTFFQPAFIDASSGAIELDVLASPTPTATFTPTTRSAPDDDGCATSRARSTDRTALALLLVPALLIVARARRMR